ncbi:MAG: bifunctional 3,4-dihydroxy-2-butanone-4-phosphate synthase/GTP cyclohydrolase II [Kiritimatiellae bacterium]|nr:bifunctional 3,4-dihydroxy-2-butanone-4-phosphate synthase/GTP cyclohydrolase II [Kiritimatiellia bacterium]
MGDTDIHTSFDSISVAIDAFRAGRMVLVVDDERRENEGDLIIAADHATPDAINFMIKQGGGLVCIAMSPERLKQLGISRMAPVYPGDMYRTAFMESVDARSGVSTGISAADRAQTVRVLMDPESTKDDLSRPGHLFPLESVPGGVLQRAGHTEAAVDLARLSGCQPAGVICEILREDGQMARRDELIAFARRHRLPIITIADLIVYRRAREPLTERECSIRLPTEWAEFQMHMYRAKPENEHHLALCLGSIAGDPPPLVRMHSECLTGDVFGSQRCDCGAQLHRAMAMVAQEGRGAVLYLRQEGRGIGLAHKIHAYALQEAGLDTVEANERLGFDPDLRDYSAAAHMLRDLGATRVRLLTNNPHKVEELEKYGISVVERIPLKIPPGAHNEKYLRAKRDKLGHLL